MVYSLLRPLLFSLPAETAHQCSLGMLDALESMGFGKVLAGHPPANPVKVMGIDFPNPVGLAAGLDKNGDHIDGLAALGFGFLEIGTVTPRPQAGNPKPRLFRLPRAQGIINRMGFNNEGVDALLQNVQQSHFRGVLGINIGKNADTPIEKATDDYLIGLTKVYPHASYVTVNISSPNTKNLRQLQQGDEFSALLAALKKAQLQLADRHGRYVPIAVKIAPDLEMPQLVDMAELLVKHQMDGVIATNTTLSRIGVEHLRHAGETGGLSGAPVRRKSTQVLREMVKLLDGAMPVIGVGGIFSGDDVREKLDAGASLVQLYSGLIYRGPGLVKEAVEATLSPRRRG
ncbi:quinone-dependent dihydroorotate dehydrogenase [Leeia aquatica]|uniref:Dihydroorotate dehydrogenase (quinone) n=1 Tax=Leeia aquatica TaxID=2725557 RepID=A0A847S1Q0_9NEIS|nr:quinone-dependent dihydroorotate dehydrogenase [Leeia aquatica]NLR73644.1 quinone-dependent dihydroorotate dehydrogenase [Leeia aquatica]